MTDSTTNPAADQLPPNVEISFREDLDIETQPELRRTVERSVTMQLARMEEAVAQARAAQAERAELEEALNAPLMKLIEADPVASKTVDELRSGKLIDVDSTMELSAEQPRAATNADVTVPLEDLEASQAQFRVSEFRLPPHDFQWSSFIQGSHPPHSQLLDKETGLVGLDARSGAMPGGVSGFVKAHAGFGMVIRPVSGMVQAQLGSYPRMAFRFQARAIGIGANATTEGGTDLAALEDGRLLNVASGKLWRARVSGLDESASGEDDLVIVTDPYALRFTMFPGRRYTVNVGIWVYADRTPGAGAAAAQSILEGTVKYIQVSWPV